ncbi:hypothetical protein H480_43210 [Amycolatopsis vancoresmycina DSM 44592]|uniref:HPC2 multi-domain protein n=2 Tax=Amycolatopsis vancoresmycina TaxID=208444 RepID=R1FG11_9PSEU|nr:hypothetical protein H480_43210 [Amycolatopsis vancoresmycina DSM 44592]
MTAAMRGEPRLSAWTAQLLLAGQNLVGNQATANRATALAPAAPAPDKNELGKDGTAGERPDKGVKETGPRSPGSDPKFQALKKDVSAKKKMIGASHPPPAAEAGAAQDAAEAPADDREARGKAAHAEDMAAAQPKEFDKQAFIQAVRKAIADKAPKNLDEADKFGESGRAEEVKNEVQGKVGEGKDASAQEIAETTAAPPEPAPDAKQVVPLAADRVPGKPGAPDPAQAAPDRLPPSATDLSAGPAQVDRQLADAQVTEQQLSFKNSREPRFDKAVTEKKALEAHSEAAPKKLRADEAGELGRVENTAAVRGSAAMAGIHAARVATGRTVGTGKQGAKKTDEDRRKEVTDLLQQVFDRTKCDVEKILTDLDKKVDDQFTTQEKQARDRFTREHEEGMQRYKDERYGGAFGWARWTRDLFAGLPEEANRIYERAKDTYLAAMDRIITEIAGTVEAELKRAKDRIAAGRTELKAAVDQLPADLKAIGREAATEFEGRFDELKDTVNDKGTELVDTLATKYTDAVKAVDEEIAAEKEKNQGLVAKAAAAIGGAVEAILELGRMLLGVLRKAVSAIGAILKDPIGFLGNLVTGVGGGLKLFMKNAGRHLEGGVLAWLLGTGGSLGLQLPTTFDILGILSLIATVLGLSWPNIRARLARRVPEQALVAAETAVPIVAEVKRRGVAAMWDDLKTRVGDLKKDLIGNLVSYLLPTIIIAGITWIVSLFNPASAFIRACKMIIDIIRFVVTNARQIIDFVNAVLDAVLAIARGGTGGVPALVERALARAIPVLIGALAALLGIGGIAAKVKEVFQKLARPVNRAVDWVVDKIAALVKKLWAKLKAALDRKRKRKHGKPHKSLPKRLRDRVRGGDDTPAGQRKRLAAALAAGVAAVNRFRGRPVAGRILQPLLTVIRLRYGLDTLRPVVQGEHWAVYGRINPEGTRDSAAKAEGDRTTDANPDFTEDAKAFERKLAAKAATHRAANSAMAGMARRAKAYIKAKAGGKWDRADAKLAEVLTKIGQEDPHKSGYVGKAVQDVMAVFDSGTLTERFVHLTEFFTNVLGMDILDPRKQAEVDEFIAQAGLNLAFLDARREDMREAGITPETVQRRQLPRAMAPLRPGSAVGQQHDSRDPRPEGESRELGLTLAETGFRFSARQVRMQRRLDPDWTRDQVLRWVAGSKVWMMKESNQWVQAQRQLGLPLGAGPSGTTVSMMSAAVVLGGEPYATRLACIAFLVGAQHHTLVEVMAAAKEYSCDYTPGRRMYRDVRPLAEATLRACGKNGKFPDEAPGTPARP